MLIDNLAKRRLLFPVRKAALMLATHWPFPVLARLSNGVRMWVDLRSAIGRGILVTGTFDEAVWRTIESHLKTDSVFLDVGANVGYYTMLASSLVGKNGKVHAFEIDPRPLRCLKRNARDCPDRNICVHEVAIGDRVGSGVLMAKADCGHSSVESEGTGARVNMISLDHWLDNSDAPSRIDVIKLDIEGGECAALAGAQKLIERYRPIIVCEAYDGGTATEHDAMTNKLLRFFSSINYSTAVCSGVFDPTIVAIPE